MKNKLIVWTFVCLILIASVLAITGTGETYEIDGHKTTASFNTTGSFQIRGLSDYIAGQFKYPSITEILLRGRFSILEAENTAPTTPNLVIQNNNTYSNITLTSFTWENSTDLEQDLISYLFEIYNDSALTEEYHINYSIVETDATTSNEVNITEDGDYYWRVAANDSRSNSTFTDLRIITIDLTLPNNFNLTTPTDGTSSTDNTPELVWNSSADTNFENYTIELSTEADFSAITNTENSSTNSFSDWSTPLTANTYYWRISSVDKANNQRQSDNNLSFIVTAVTETQTVAGGASVSSGGATPRPYSFHIIAPPSVTIFKDQSIIIPIEIENIGRNIKLNEVRLRAESDVAGVEVTLDRELIPVVKADSKEIVNLIINAANSLRNSFSVSITADVDNPRMTDTAKIITTIIGEEGQTQESAQSQLIFARKFFDGNPECSQLVSLLNDAEAQIEEDYNAAFNSISRAIDSCKDLVAVKGPVKTSLLDITINAVRENKTTAIISSQIVGILIIGLTIYGKFFRKRRIKEIKLDF